MGPVEELKLKDLTFRTVMLVVLLSGQRCQTVHALTLSGMEEVDDQITLEILKYTVKDLQTWQAY